MILVGIGVVNEGYNTSEMPDVRDRTVEYLTDGNILDAENNIHRRQTKGIKNDETKLSVNLITVKLQRGDKNLVNGVVVLKGFLK